MKKYYPSPARIKPTFLEGTTFTNIRPLDIKNNIVYGTQNDRILIKSSDMFKTIISIYDFGVGFSIMNLKKLDNETILVFVSNESNKELKWYIVKEGSTVVVEVVNTTDGNLGVPSTGRLHLIDCYGGIVIVGTYGNTIGVNQQRIFMSRDSGKTWKTIWDTPIGANTVNQHVHSVWYDKYRNYIWTALGDHDNAVSMYSTDLGRTWKQFYRQVRNQFINIMPMADRLICDTDISPDGVFTIPLTNEGMKPSPDLEKTKLSLIQHIDDSPTFYNFAFRGICDDSSYPWNIIIPYGGQEGNKIQNPVIMTYNGEDCYNIFEITKDAESSNFTFTEGDLRIEYLVGATNSSFTIDGTDYSNYAIGRGLVYKSNAWVYCLVYFKIPKWICIE